MNGLTLPGLVMRIKKACLIDESFNRKRPATTGRFLNGVMIRVLEGFLLLLRAPFLPAGCAL